MAGAGGGPALRNHRTVDNWIVSVDPDVSFLEWTQNIQGYGDLFTKSEKHLREEIAVLAELPEVGPVLQAHIIPNVEIVRPQSLVQRGEENMSLVAKQEVHIIRTSSSYG